MNTYVYEYNCNSRPVSRPCKQLAFTKAHIQRERDGEREGGSTHTKERPKFAEKNLHFSFVFFCEFFFLLHNIPLLVALCVIVVVVVVFAVTYISRRNLFDRFGLLCTLW